MAYWGGDPDPEWDNAQERAHRRSEQERQALEGKRIRTPQELREIEQRDLNASLSNLNNLLLSLDMSSLTSKGGEVKIPGLNEFKDFEIDFTIEWFKKFGWVASLYDYESVPPKKVVRVVPA
jgi:hypothetical protein